MEQQYYKDPMQRLLHILANNDTILEVDFKNLYVRPNY